MSEKVLDTVARDNDKLLFLERCKAAELRVRGKYASMHSTRAELAYQENIWDKESLSDEERLVCLNAIKQGIRARKFAQPALHAVFADESQAKFLDDFLWNHMGDPITTGKAKPKGPGNGDGVSEYNYDYVPLFNGYTDEGTLVHIRETRDKEASAKDRYAIILGDMATLEVARYRINDIENTVDHTSGALTQKLVITTDVFDAIDGVTPYEGTYTASGLMQLNESIVAQEQRHKRQASVTLGQQSILYKPFGGSEQTMGGIDRVVRDRDLLARLARAAGVVRDNNASIYLPHSYLHPKAA